MNGLKSSFEEFTVVFRKDVFEKIYNDALSTVKNLMYMLTFFDF